MVDVDLTVLFSSGIVTTSVVVVLLVVGSVEFNSTPGVLSVFEDTDVVSTSGVAVVVVVVVVDDMVVVVGVVVVVVVDSVVVVVGVVVVVVVVVVVGCVASANSDKPLRRYTHHSGRYAGVNCMFWLEISIYKWGFAVLGQKIKKNTIPKICQQNTVCLQSTEPIYLTRCSPLYSIVICTAGRYPTPPWSVVSTTFGARDSP